MKTVTVKFEVPVADIAQAVAEEISTSKRRNNRAALIAAQIGMPDINDAIQAVIAATEKVDNAQTSRGELGALNELFKAAKKLRVAFRYTRTIDKETKQ